MTYQKRLLGVIVTTILALMFIYIVPSAQASVKNDMNGDGVVKMTVMGDSFSSGVGATLYKDSSQLLSLGSSSIASSVEGYDNATVTATNGCFRSESAYGPIAASVMGYELNFIACSGAKISNMLYEQQFAGEPIQTEAIPYDTDIVVLTAGGNDIGFGDYVACVIIEECSRHSPAAARIFDGAVNELPVLLDQLITKIKHQAPSARIVLLGYVIGLEPRDNIPVIPGGMCFPYFSKPEMEMTYVLRDSLNDSIYDAAVRHGVEYVDPHVDGSPFNSANASICSSSGASANHSPSYDLFSELGAGRSAHPTSHANSVQAEMLTSLLSS